MRLSILILGLILISCEKQKTEQEPAFFAEYTINDTIKIKTGFCLLYDTRNTGYFDIICRTLNEFNEIQEELVFHNLTLSDTLIPLEFVKVGTTNQNLTPSALLRTSEGDAGTECYTPIKNDNSHSFQLIDINQDTSEIKAEFNLTLEISSDCPITPWNKYPDTLLITNGILKAERAD